MDAGGEARAHAIFFHGLRGSIEGTWGSLAKKRFWPLWFTEEIEGLAIWAVGYPAPALIGRPSLALPDLASAVSAKLAIEPGLRTGNIALVGYSLGGTLAITALMAAGDARSDANAQDFFHRVDRLATIGTPHAGSRLASSPAGRLFGSKLARGLGADDPWLRQINRRFLEWHAGQPQRAMSLLEGAGTRGLPVLIVEPDSANPGLRRAYQTDATHETIVKVSSQQDFVYQQLSDFLRGLVAAPQHMAGPALRSQPVLPSGGAASQGASAGSRASDQLRAITEASQAASGVIDAEIAEKLKALRRGRLIPSFPRERVEAFERELLRLRPLAGDETLREAFGWMGRFLALRGSEARARAALQACEDHGGGDLAVIGWAFLEGLDDRDAGLARLGDLASPLARSASLFIGTRDRPVEEAVVWAKERGPAPESLDPDGLTQLISLLLQARRWDQALEVAVQFEAAGAEAPQFLLLAGQARLIATMPEELRDLLGHLPLHPRTFPLAGEGTALLHRRAAVPLFDAFAIAARALECPNPAGLAEDLSLWLRLKDPDTRDPALEELRRSTRSADLTIRRINLLLDYGVELDIPAVERELERQELGREGSAEAAAARFALAFTQDTPGAAADYLRQRRAQLETHLAPGPLALAEAELLARAGRPTEARQRLQEAAAEIASDARARAEAVIADAEAGADVVDAALRRFRENPSVVHRAELVEQLVARGDWAQARPYAEELLRLTADVHTLRTLTRILNELSDFQAMDTVLEQHPQLREAEPELSMQWAWSLYRRGDLGAASAALARLDAEDVNAASLRANIALAGGRWDQLADLVEYVHKHQDKASTADLLRAGRLAGYIGSSRAESLIRAAVARAPDDPQVLINAYGIEVDQGRESKASEWMKRAIEASGEEGPVKRVSLNEIVAEQPKWQSAQEQVQAQVQSGQLPVFMAAKLGNDTLLRRFLTLALINADEPDPRRRAILPIRAGVAKPAPPPLRRVAMDPTTILVLLLTDLLERAIAALEEIVIPHDTLTWLFTDSQKLRFHQPSLVAKARKIHDDLARGWLSLASPGPSAPEALIADAGVALAQLLADAKARDKPGEAHRVVRSPPIHRPGSLGAEDADLGDFEEVRCSCSDVVDALTRGGLLTHQEEAAARDFLALQETPGQAPRTVPAGATLYLDGLSLGYLNDAGLLERLHRAGFTVLVCPEAMNERNQLLSYDLRSQALLDLVERGRACLETAIASGKIRLGANFKIEAEDMEIPPHPSLDLFHIAGGADAVVVDDRALGRYDNVETEAGLVPVISSFELLKALSASGAISPQERLLALHRMRRMNMAFLPVEPEELEAGLARAVHADDEGVTEPLELRTLRENLQSLQASAYLQIPQEAPWLMGLMSSLKASVRAQWSEASPEELAEARTRWLFELHDLRGWAHRLPGPCEPDRMDALFARPLLLMMAQAGTSSPEGRRYQRWLDEIYLPFLKEMRPKLYRALTAYGRVFVEEEPSPEETADG